jgi:hypothetical protein
MVAIEELVHAPVPVDGYIHFDIKSPASWSGGDVRVVFLEPESAIPVPHTERTHRIGFLKDRVSVPDNFDTMGQDEIIKMFEGEE